MFYPILLILLYMSNILANKVQSFTCDLVLVSSYKFVAMIYCDLTHNRIWLIIHYTTFWIQYELECLETEPCHLYETRMPFTLSTFYMTIQPYGGTNLESYKSREPKKLCTWFSWAFYTLLASVGSVMH